jgi:hypothetical protein
MVILYFFIKSLLIISYRRPSSNPPLSRYTLLPQLARMIIPIIVMDAAYNGRFHIKGILMEGFTLKGLICLDKVPKKREVGLI